MEDKPLKALAFAADGTEAAELIVVVDILKRANISVEIVSVEQGVGAIMCSGGIGVVPDIGAWDHSFSDADLLYFPGGRAGAAALAKKKELIELTKRHLAAGKRIAAICAAPALVLGANGLLKGVRATCYPGFENEMKGAIVSDERVVTDGQITTARGMGCSTELGLELVGLLRGEDEAERIRKAIIY